MDFAREGLKVGDLLIKKFGADPSKCHRAVASIARLPIKDCSVVGVVGAGFLHHLEDPEEGLREIHRVLRPGGFLFTINEMTRAKARAPNLPTQWDRAYTYDEWKSFARSCHLNIQGIGIGAGVIGRIAPKIAARWYDRKLRPLRAVLDFINAAFVSLGIVLFLTKPDDEEVEVDHDIRNHNSMGTTDF